MKHRLIAAVAFAALLGASSHASAGFVTVGDYDPAGDANDVDQSGTFASATGSAGASNVVDLATFRASVASAFALNMGGVINFDSGGLEDLAGNVDNDGGQYIRTTYGTSGLKLIELFSDSSADDFDFPGATSNNRVPTSGTQSLGKDSETDEFHINVGTITGGAVGEGVVAMGFTVIDRQSTNIGSPLSVIATFSDGSTVTSTASITGTAANSQDSFFGFVAPSGTTITRLFANPGGFTTIDDLAFVTAVPEPAALAPMLLAGTALARRRRRQ